MADLPFLKNKNKKKDGVPVIGASHTTDLTEHVTDELMQALDRKDIKAIREALKALVLMTKDEDQA